MNTLIVPGTYSITGADSPQNCPLGTGLNSIVIVKAFGDSGSNRRCQYISDSNNNVAYQRFGYYNTDTSMYTWDAWKKFVFE